MSDFARGYVAGLLTPAAFFVACILAGCAWGWWTERSYRRGLAGRLAAEGAALLLRERSQEGAK